MKKIQLELVPFWIQLRGIPLGLTSEANVRRLVCDVGEFLELEDPSKAGGFLRARVVVNMLNLLVPGCSFSRGQDTDTWVEFRYERLQDFCYSCGKIGYVNTECSFKPLRGGSAGYGEWTKAASIWEVLVPQRSLTLGVGERQYTGTIRSSRMEASQRSRGDIADEPQKESDCRAERLIQHTLP